MGKIAFVVMGGLLVAACGSSTPVTPTPSPVPTATPAPAPTPTATPAPTPTPDDGGEPPVTNTNPAARLSIRLYVVEDPGGGYINNPDPNNVPAGYTARIDVTANVVLDEVDGQGHQIVESQLEVRARAPGLEQAAFDEAVEAADRGCPFSRLIAAAAKVTINATLED